MPTAKQQIGKVLKRRNAWRKAFLTDEGKLSADGELMLADLKRFCRWDSSTTIVSPVSKQVDVPASFQAEGRREVLVRILAHINVDDGAIIRATERLDDNE